MNYIDSVVLPKACGFWSCQCSLFYEEFTILTFLFVLIGSKTSCHSSADAPGQQDKNRSYKDADSSGSPDQWIGFW